MGCIGGFDSYQVCAQTECIDEQTIFLLFGDPTCGLSASQNCRFDLIYRFEAAYDPAIPVGIDRQAVSEGVEHEHPVVLFHSGRGGRRNASQKKS